jgi:hypothetical protein
LRARSFEREGAQDTCDALEELAHGDLGVGLDVPHVSLHDLEPEPANEGSSRVSAARSK